MSGVLGVVDPESAVDASCLIGKMTSVMCHQDWYTADRFVDHECNLALGRIGIGIFNTTPQPVWNAAHTIALLMAGELYDSVVLKTNGDADRDESTALELYEKLGEGFVAHLEGAFVIAIWDGTRQRLLIANDRFGLYPTYIARVGNRLIFAPEVKGVLVDTEVNRSLRDDSVAEYMRFQRLLGFKTFFAGVTMLPPASLLTYDYRAAAYRTDRYWDMGRVPPLPESLTFEEAVEEGSRLFRLAVKKMTRGTERVGVFLSGGLDSRSILGMIPPGGRPVHTFTFGQPRCRDVFYAQQIAKAAGTLHHHYPYENGDWIRENVDLHLELTEGFQSWIHIHGLGMLSDVREHIDVNLSGLGDLLWSQSNFTPLHVAAAPDAIAFETLLFELYNQKYSWPGITYPEERFLYRESFFPRVRGLALESFVRELAPFADLPCSQRLAAFNLLNHFSRMLLYSGVVGRSYIEYRFPYFDLPLMSFCYGLPYELGRDRRLQRAIIVEAIPSLARIPEASDELPITNRRHERTIAHLARKMKDGFHRYVAPVFPPRPVEYADYAKWLRTDLRAWTEALLFDERTLERGIFEPKALRSLMARHLAGHEEWTLGKIAPIMTFEMMLRRYCD